MIQIWPKLIIILIFKYLKAIAKYKWYLSNLVASLRLNLFLKIELKKWIAPALFKKEKPPNISNKNHLTLAIKRLFYKIECFCSLLLTIITL
jgi:hypothetical protein